MKTEEYGAEGFTEQDRAYDGSCFTEVREAVFANPYQQVWGRQGSDPLPVYKVTLSSVLHGVLSFGRRYLFKPAVAAQSILMLICAGARTKNFRRLLHPNGVCLTGRWQITEETEYSGYFGKGSEALAVGRYSTCCTETRRGRTRSLALVGKLFPTTDTNHPQPLRTANFLPRRISAAITLTLSTMPELRNAPDVHGLRHCRAACRSCLLRASYFNASTKNPHNVQLYQIAELGKPDNEPTRAPRFMRLLVASDQPKIGGDALDFRDEVMAQIFDRGDAARSAPCDSISKLRRRFSSRSGTFTKRPLQ